MNIIQLTPNQSKAFCCNLPTYIEQKTTNFKEPISDIESMLISAIPIINKLPYSNYQNEKLVKEIWDKTDAMTNEIYRIKNHLYQNPIDLNLKNSDFNYYFEKYDEFLHDIGNPLFVIGGYSNNILNKIRNLIPNSNRKYLLESMFESILDKTKYIGDDLKKGNINSYLN